MAVSTIYSERFHKATKGMLDLMQSYPGMEKSHHLSGHLQLLANQASVDSQYPIELILLDMPGEQQLFRLLDFLMIIPDQGRNIPLQLSDTSYRFQYQHTLSSGQNLYRITIYNSAHLPVRSTANLAPCLKIVCWFADSPPTEDEIEPILLRLDAEGGIVYFLNYATHNFLEGAPNLIIYPLSPENLPATFCCLLDSDKHKPLLPLAHTARLVEGLEKVSESFYQYISQQEKDIKTRKFNAQQDINVVKQEEKINLRDLFQQVKAGLQREFSECERGIQDRLMKLGQRHSPNSLMAEVENFIQQVDHLQEENYAGNIRMTLPGDTREQLTSRIYDGLRTQIDQDIFAFKEFIKQQSDDLGSTIQQQNINFSYTPKIQINLSRIQANISEYLQFTQKYELEKKKLTAGDYIRGALGPFMAMGGLFMVMNIMGINLRAKFRGGNKYITIPLIIIICGYSLYQFLKNTKSRKTREYEEGLKRMKESLLAEAKGIIRKVTDEWQREFIGGLREELNQMVSTLEQLFSRAGDEHKDRIQQSQRSVQRRVQGLEQRERSHQTVLKNKETFDRALAQFKGELMHQFEQQLKKL